MAPFMAPDDVEQKLYDYLLIFEEYGRKKVRLILEFIYHSCKPRNNYRELPSRSNSLSHIRFSITDELCGVRNTIHGELTGALIDDLGTVLLGAISQPWLFSQIGASKNLNSTFIRPVSLGEEVRVVCELKYVCKKRALMRGRLYKIDTDELCVITENDRANTDLQVRAKM